MNEETKPSRKFHSRGFVSVLLFASFLVLLVTSAILYASPKGRVAHWTGWSVLGLGKEEWSAVHMVCGLLVVIASVFHLYFNWALFWGYLKRRTEAAIHLKKEISLAILVCIVTVGGTVMDVPPFSTIVQWNEDIKTYWENESAAMPSPHAEEFSIVRFAEEIGMPLEDVLAKLKEAGIEVKEPSSMKVIDLADQHGMTPSELYAAIQPDATGAGGGGGGGGQGQHGGGMGYGRMNLEKVCEAEGIPVEKAIERLRTAGIEANGNDALRTLADEADLRPNQIVDIIRGE
jgi:hypothetical protein